jgi:hypothetical protein
MSALGGHSNSNMFEANLKSSSRSPQTPRRTLSCRPRQQIFLQCGFAFGDGPRSFIFPLKKGAARMNEQNFEAFSAPSGTSAGWACA